MKRILPALLWWLGLALSVIPTLIAVLEWFPIWAAEGGQTVISGLTAVLLALAAMPLLNLVRDRLKSPSLWCFWLFVLLFLLAVRRVLEGLLAVALVSFPAGLIGAVCFRISRHLKQRRD